VSYTGGEAIKVKKARNTAGRKKEVKEKTTNWSAKEIMETPRETQDRMKSCVRGENTRRASKVEGLDRLQSD